MDPVKDPSGNGRSETSDASGVPPGTSGAFPTFQIPDHELLRCIGRGSYGEVWLARNMMGVYRAVKLVYRKSFQHQKPFERELSGIRKFEPISRSHEGFVDVLHVGQSEQGGCFYYVMELGDDQDAGQAIEPKTYAPRTLAKEISRRGKLAVSDCSRIGLALSQALAELHKHGLVHRDIKPSNIIFVNGVPKLADIGLVAGVDEARSYVGTEGFIPPEGPGTPQADIYSLGKVLYEASTGRDRQDFPELPTHWDESSEHEAMLELNEIILRACKQELNRRYATAGDMEADLVVLANGKSVRRLKLLERRVATLKRLGSIAALLLAVAAGILYQTYRGIAKAHRAQIAANIASGDLVMESGDLLGALPYFAEAIRLDADSAEHGRSHRLRFGSTAAQCPKLTHFWLAPQEVYDGQFSSNGQRVLIAEYMGQARLYDLPDGSLRGHPFGTNWGLVTAALSPDGKLAALGYQDAHVVLWDTERFQPVLTLPHPERVRSVRFSGDGLRLVTTCADAVARVWDAGDGHLELKLTGHTKSLAYAEFSRDGKYIVTASQDGTARVWSAVDGRQIGQTGFHARMLTHAALSPDNQRLVTTCEDDKVRVWDVRTGRRFGPDLKHRAVLRTAEFSPDGRLLLTASLDRTVHFWRAADLQPMVLNPLLRHMAPVTRAAFSPDGQSVLTCCSDGSVRIWDLGGGMVVPVQRLGSFSSDGRRWLMVTNDAFRVADAAGTNQALSPMVQVNGVLEKAQFGWDGSFVITLSAQGSAGVTNHFVQVYDAESGRLVGAPLAVQESPSATVLSRDGRRLVTLVGNLAELWDVPSAKAIGAPLAHTEPVRGAVFSPDGSRMATRAGNQVYVWNSATGKLAFTPWKRRKPIEYIDFSPDGRYLVACCSDDTLDACSAQIWDAASGHEVGAELKHDDGVLFAVFSPDSRRIVTCGEDRVAILWDVQTGRQLAPPFTHDHHVKSAAFSPDGKWLATVSPDHTARVWNPETGDPLTPSLRHEGLPAKVMFSPDSSKLITSDIHGQTNWIWELPLATGPVEDLLLRARVLAGSGFGQQAQSLESSWTNLSGKYEADFSSSKPEETIWHETQEAESEAEGQWSAAVFHLEHLLALRPGDPELTRRLEAARRQASKQD